MTQEQYILAAQPNTLSQRVHQGAQAYPVGIYGWRKRCLYFFILLLLVTMIVNLALTIWILKVMNFTVDNPLILQSDRNVTVNARNDVGQLTGQLTVGSEMVEAQCQRFEVRSPDGERVLFSADEKEISIGTEKLRVTGNEGVVFGHSVETSHIRAEPFQDLNEEPFIDQNYLAIAFEHFGKELFLSVCLSVFPSVLYLISYCLFLPLSLLLSFHLTLQIFLDSNTIRLGNIPHGTVADPLHGAPGTTYPKQTVYELCVCPSGKLYLSPAEIGSTCQTTSNVCLWS
uniref:Sarcoglycan zeta n=1 Tax=Hucho hucho TaxID=62062 RepID=A0A4W5QGG5_9TELE